MTEVSEKLIWLCQESEQSYRQFALQQYQEVAETYFTSLPSIQLILYLLFFACSFHSLVDISSQEVMMS